MVAAVLLIAAVGACSKDADSSAATSTTSPRESSTSSTTTTSSGAESPASDDGDTGSIDDVADLPEPAPVEAPVALDAVADFGGGTTARVSDLSAIAVEAKLPGEISGPAVRVAVEITNGSDAPIDLSNVAVLLTTASGMPTTTFASTDDQPFTGSVEPGASATGTYVFSVGAADRDGAQLSVKYAADAPTVVFSGDLPR